MIGLGLAGCANKNRVGSVSQLQELRWPTGPFLYARNSAHH